MDITPLINDAKKIINSYGDGNFTITGEKFSGNIIITQDNVYKWDVTNINNIDKDSFSPIIEQNIELLLIGTGEKHIHISNKIRMELKAEGFNIEVMQTSAACRTYNVLLAEGRSVAVALIAV